MRIQAQNCGSLRAGSIIGTGCDHRLYVLTDKNQVLAFDGDNVVEHGQLKDSACLSFQFIQPMPGGFLAVVDNTGYLLDFDGKLISEIELGQHIQDVQTTSAGDIWVSYSDQAFGRNLHMLRTFHRDGKWGAPSGVEEMFDCYALNVTSIDEAWCCYNPKYPLVKIKAHHDAGHWFPEINGVSAFAIWRDLAMLQGGYEEDDWKVVRLGESGRVVTVETVEIVSEDDEILDSRNARARGPLIWNIHRNRVYRTSLRDLNLDRK